MNNKNIKRPTPTLSSVSLNTRGRREQVERFRKMVEDENRAERLKSQECVVCFHGSRVALSAITGASCGYCGKDMTFGSSDVDDLCYDCAKKLRLCKHCGCDIDLKERRKL